MHRLNCRARPTIGMGSLFSVENTDFFILDFELKFIVKLVTGTRSFYGWVRLRQWETTSHINPKRERFGFICDVVSHWWMTWPPGGEGVGVMLSNKRWLKVYQWLKRSWCIPVPPTARKLGSWKKVPMLECSYFSYANIWLWLLEASILNKYLANLTSSEYYL